MQYLFWVLIAGALAMDAVALWNLRAIRRMRSRLAEMDAMLAQAGAFRQPVAPSDE